MPPGERWLRLPAEIPHTGRNALSERDRRHSRARHRHREVFQLYRDQVAYREAALPTHQAVQHGTLKAGVKPPPPQSSEVILTTDRPRAGSAGIDPELCVR